MVCVDKGVSEAGFWAKIFMRAYIQLFAVYWLKIAKKHKIPGQIVEKLAFDLKRSRMSCVFSMKTKYL